MTKFDANYAVLGGDLNTDISRNTPHTDSLVDFTTEYNVFMY